MARAFTTTRQTSARSQSADGSTSLSHTRTLLGLGVLAGPLYLSLGLAQALTRPGYDLTRHDLSLLSNGDFGWIQISNFFLTGAFIIAGAVGLRRALPTGRGRALGPLLVAGYGLGIIGAGFFSADPVPGFPPGTPSDATAISWHGMLHIVSGGLGFLALICACGVLARRFAGMHQTGWTIYSAFSGVVFLAAFIGIASGSGNPWTVIGFWIGLVIAFSWLSMLSWRLMSELPTA